FSRNVALAASSSSTPARMRQPAARKPRDIPPAPQNRSITTGASPAMQSIRKPNRVKDATRKVRADQGPHRPCSQPIVQSYLQPVNAATACGGSFVTRCPRTLSCQGDQEIGTPPAGVCHQADPPPVRLDHLPCDGEAHSAAALPSAEERVEDL